MDILLAEKRLIMYRSAPPQLTTNVSKASYLIYALSAQIMLVYPFSSTGLASYLETDIFISLFSSSRRPDRLILTQTAVLFFSTFHYLLPRPISFLISVTFLVQGVLCILITLLILRLAPSFVLVIEATFVIS